MHTSYILIFRQKLLSQAKELVCGLVILFPNIHMISLSADSRKMSLTAPTHREENEQLRDIGGDMISFKIRQLCMVNSIVTLQLFDSLGKVVAACFSFELIYLSQFYTQT